MSLPNTAAGILVLVLALIPGLPAGKIYDAAVGVSWREADIRFAIRVLSFSLLGLVVYAIVAQQAGWQPPSYVLPRTFTAPSFSASQLGTLAAAYSGHVIGSMAVGLVAALGLKLLVAVSPLSGDRDSWDKFINYSSPNHWVVISLRTGEVYAAKLHHADVSVEPEFRDIILEEPAQLDRDTGEYRSTSHQHLFIRGRDIASIATYYDDTEDERITEPGEELFG